MRTYLFFATLFSMFIITIIAAYKPSMIENEYNKIKEPIENYYAEKNAKVWQKAKNKEWEIWSKQIEMPKDCTKPNSAIRELECKNQWQLQVNTFEKIWANKITRGWKPSGTEN